MEALDLKAETRQTVGKHVKQLRREGYVPAVVYGKNKETDLIQVEAKALNKVLSEAGTHQLIALQVGTKKPLMTLAREIQRDSIKRSFLHVDFYAVNMKEKVSAAVPLVFVGISPAVRDLGGVLVHGLNEIEIECLPSDLVASIEVNIDDLAQYNDMITVAQLKVPDTITVLTDPESMVAKIETPVTAEALAELEAPVAEPEVLTGAKERAEEE